MSDIVERLRHKRKLMMTHEYEEAADEIDQITALKAEWDRLLDDFFKVCQRNAELMLECDRLREALIDLVQECEEYARINHLHNDDGSPATTGAMKHAYAALAKAGQ